MIKLKLSLINQMSFTEAVKKLMALNTIPGSVAYKIAKIGKGLEEELKTARDTFKKLQEPFLVKDEAGKVLLEKTEKGESVPGTEKIIPEKKEEWAKVYADLLETEVTLSLAQIPFQFLEHAKLSPSDLLLLEPLIAMEPEAAPKLEVVK